VCVLAISSRCQKTVPPPVKGLMTKWPHHSGRSDLHQNRISTTPKYSISSLVWIAGMTYWAFLHGLVIVASGNSDWSVCPGPSPLLLSSHFSTPKIIISTLAIYGEKEELHAARRSTGRLIHRARTCSVPFDFTFSGSCLFVCLRVFLARRIRVARIPVSTPKMFKASDCRWLGRQAADHP